MGADDARALIPRGASLSELREAARGCRACDLWKLGTQTVFGEVGDSEGSEGSEGSAGNDDATVAVMFVGEQPGDREDREGRPFVGPAGRLLDQGLHEAGIDRRTAYVTNVVKHFKWTPRGKRRIHKKPGAEEIAACRPWLEAELALVKPRVLVCLGATAAQALLGRDFRVSRDRGRLIESDLAPAVMATVHPSSILRAGDDDSRAEEMRAFVKDLQSVARALRKDPAREADRLS